MSDKATGTGTVVAWYPAIERKCALSLSGTNRSKTDYEKDTGTCWLLSLVVSILGASCAVVKIETYYCTVD
jgi:hypothetical protein